MMTVIYYPDTQVWAVTRGCMCVPFALDGNGMWFKERRSLIAALKAHRLRVTKTGNVLPLKKKK